MDIGRQKRPNGCRAFQSLLRSEGAVPVVPVAFMEAVTRHALEKQEKDDCQNKYKQKTPNSELGWSSTCRRRQIRISRHQGCLSAISGNYQLTAIHIMCQFPHRRSNCVAPQQLSLRL